MSQKEIWDDLVGDAWVRNADLIDEQSKVFGEAAMDLLGVLAGKAILDVGCGTGSTTVAFIQRGAASALGVDLSERMLARALERKVEGVSFQAADVTTVEGRFDAVFSRFGVMFFDDPVTAFAHLRELTIVDGRLGFACWRDPFANPWMSLAMMAAIPVLGPPQLPAPDEPGPFSLASPDRIRQVLGDAGWSDITVDELTLERTHPAGSANAVAAVVVEQAPPLAIGLAAHPDRVDEVVALVADAFRPHERDGAVVLQASCNIVGATAPA